MTAVTTIRIVTPAYATVAATYELYTTGPARPDLYAHLSRPGRRYRWTVTAGANPAALTRAQGRAWTRDGAVGKAIAAARRPSVRRAS